MQHDGIEEETIVEWWDNDFIIQLQEEVNNFLN
jgi:hypothetical protein